MNPFSPIIEPLRGMEPKEAFLALRSLPHAVWLDSVIPKPRGRFSVVAADPILVISAKEGVITTRSENEDTVTDGNPFDSMAGWFANARKPPHSPTPFSTGAAIGFFGYDLKNHLERLPYKAVDDTGLPQMWWGIYDVLFVFDREKKEAWLVSTGLNPRGEREEKLARDRASQFSQRLNAKIRSEPVSLPQLSFSLPQSNFTHAQYLTAIQRAKDYIAQGDVYQINLSQRFESRTSAPLDGIARTALYLRLRETNPAPFAAFLDIGDEAILSSSPECFLDITDRTVRTFPIKGTRPRGATPGEDERLLKELSRSRKDNAELVMIVDLQRNDLGRVCEFGSVRVPDLVRVESYLTVHHLVATVEGTLREGVSHLDCIRACFPGGSITGTPKIRAMEIIDHLEPHARGVYTGAIGMIGLPDAEGHQQTVLNIAIRTMTVAGDRVLFHSGGGIVADSEPESEYEETLHKASGMMAALNFFR